MDYLLIPRGQEGKFDEAALSSMRDFWKDSPYYLRSDGAYMVCLNKGVLEAVRHYKEEERPNMSSTAILFRPESILIGSVGWIELDAQTADFVEWCQARWPCELFLATGDPATAAILRHD